MEAITSNYRPRINDGKTRHYGKNTSLSSASQHSFSRPPLADARRRTDVALFFPGKGSPGFHISSYILITKDDLDQMRWG